MKDKLYEICICDKQDFKEVIDLMDLVDDTIEKDEWFVKDEKEFVLRHFEDEGFILGIRVRKKLVAYLLVRIPKQALDNLGRDVGLPKKKWDKVAHIESVGVGLGHRGNGYQRILMRKAEKYLAKMGIKYYMATIAPKNKYSLNNFIKRGYVVVKRKRKYDDLDRVIVQKEYNVDQ